MNYSLLSILRKVRMNKLYSIAVYSYITIAGYEKLEKNIQFAAIVHDVVNSKITNII